MHYGISSEILPAYATLYLKRKKKKKGLLLKLLNYNMYVSWALAQGIGKQL